MFIFVEKSCPAPPMFESHMITNATERTKDFGTIVYYRCEPGYWFNQFELGATKYLKCREDKTWEGPEIYECSSTILISHYCNDYFCYRAVFISAAVPLTFLLLLLLLLVLHFFHHYWHHHNQCDYQCYCHYYHRSYQFAATTATTNKLLIVQC